MSYAIKLGSANRPLLFLLTLAADHISPATGLVPVVALSKTGGVFAPPAGAISEVGNGWYSIAGSAVDTNTLGPLLLHATAPGADPTDVQMEILPIDFSDVATGTVAALIKMQTDKLIFTGTNVNSAAQTLPAVVLTPAEHTLIGTQDVPFGLAAQGLTSSLITSLAAQVARLYGAEWGSVTSSGTGANQVYSVAMPAGALTIPAPGAVVGTVLPAYDSTGKPTITTKTVN